VNGVFWRWTQKRLRERYDLAKKYRLRMADALICGTAAAVDLIPVTYDSDLRRSPCRRNLWRLFRRLPTSSILPDPTILLLTPSPHAPAIKRVAETRGTKGSRSTVSTTQRLRQPARARSAPAVNQTVPCPAAYSRSRVGGAQGFECSQPTAARSSCGRMKFRVTGHLCGTAVCRVQQVPRTAYERFGGATWRGSNRCFHLTQEARPPLMVRA
jgi:hypothetical protein